MLTSHIRNSRLVVGAWSNIIAMAPPLLSDLPQACQNSVCDRLSSASTFSSRFPPRLHFLAPPPCTPLPLFLSSPSCVPLLPRCRFGSVSSLSRGAQHRQLFCTYPLEVIIQSDSPSTRARLPRASDYPSYSPAPEQAAALLRVSLGVSKPFLYIKPPRLPGLQR